MNKLELICVLINKLGGKVEITEQELLELDKHSCIVYIENPEKLSHTLEVRIMEVGE